MVGFGDVGSIFVEENKLSNCAEDIDIISNLPVTIRLHILSFLSTRQAIQTTCLSKRWLHLWIWIPRLCFSIMHHPRPKRRSKPTPTLTLTEQTIADFIDFVCNYFNILPVAEPKPTPTQPKPTRTQSQVSVDFVNKSLHFHTCCGLDKFSVSFGHHYASVFDKDIDEWLRFAIRARVKELVLDLYEATKDIKDSDQLKKKKSPHYELPQQLYLQGGFLTSATLSLCYVNPGNGIVNWKSLKCLVLRLVKINEDALQKIISGSPELETLELSQFSSEIKRLEIKNHASLRKLVVGELSNPWNLKDKTPLDIIAPTILSLEISSPMCYRKCRLIDISNLVDCVLKVDYLVEDHVEQCNNFRLLLQSLTHVKNLTLGKQCLRVLCRMNMCQIEAPPRYNTCLVLEIQHGNFSCNGIQEILENSFHMETLIIHSTHATFSLSDNMSDLLAKNTVRYWTSFKLPLSHLKTIKVYGFYDKFSMSFLRILLRDANVLRKMFIEIEKGHEEDFFLHKKGTLLSFPRTSSDAVISYALAR